MLITAAEERKKGLTALYIDGEYAVSVDSVTFMSSSFKTGSEITDEQLYELIQLSNVNRAKEKALYFIEYRPRSRKEVEEKLVPVFGEDASEQAISRLEELGLIDDEVFARRYAQQMFDSKHYSAKRVSFELMKKGIDRSIIDGLIEELEPDPCEQIEKIISKKYARCLDDEKGRQRAINGLRAMGFSWQDIKECLGD